MENLFLEILEELKKPGEMDDKFVENTVRKHNKNITDNKDHHSQKKILAYYLKTKDADPEKFKSWGIDDELNKKILQLLQIKPGRTASGVAPVTVITKPWKCKSNCLYCPNDLTMPKSYMHDEPACQRAARNFFDPYLQVMMRIRALTQMGHLTDKVELIVLGGTWTDYSSEYRLWFTKELFRALNDGDNEEEYQKRREMYVSQGIADNEKDIRAYVHEEQKLVDSGNKTYNQAWDELYGKDSVWEKVSEKQVATYEELQELQVVNENANHRVVGLVIETRPDAITVENLYKFRKLGCTKIQMGVQTLSEDILKQNHRNINIDVIQNAFELLRVFGYKSHTHFMVNLYGSNIENDIEEYKRFVTEPAFQPDEIKLYPCALIDGTGLSNRYKNGSWVPYSDEELLDVLIEDTLNTPSFTRISRMMRDFSGNDIMAGTKKINLRQLVERKIKESGKPVREIRYREIKKQEVDVEDLTLDVLHYATSNTDEYFLQWVTDENGIAGFLRLSLPYKSYIESFDGKLPVHTYEAMIREVHVYGKVAGINDTSKGVQHMGLGRKLIHKAEEIAREQGYIKMNVISSVGTREYYRSLGFEDNGLYQQKSIV